MDLRARRRMKLALIIAGRLRQIWKPYVFGALSAIVAVVAVAMLGVTGGGVGVPLEAVLACLSLLAAVAGVLFAARTEGFLDELKNRFGRKRTRSCRSERRS